MPAFLRYVAISLVVVLLSSTVGASALRWLDIHYASELFKDGWGKWRFQEDWGTIPALTSQQDYRWVTSGMLVAHALGGAGGDGQNTMASMEQSLAIGLKVLEVDVWLDEEGQLRCHHGPDKPGPLKPGDCTWAKALQRAGAADAWLILDIKTEFQATAHALLHSLPNASAARKIVFQLYKPEHINLFQQWQKRFSLPGPLITVYVARRSVRHIAENAQRIGVQVLTLPLYRRAALNQDTSNLNILVHPVLDCAGVRSAAPATGYYVSIAAAKLVRQECGR